MHGLFRHVRHILLFQLCFIAFTDAHLYCYEEQQLTPVNAVKIYTYRRQIRHTLDCSPAVVQKLRGGQIEAVLSNEENGDNTATAATRDESPSDKSSHTNNNNQHNTKQNSPQQPYFFEAMTTLKNIRNKAFSGGTKPPPNKNEIRNRIRETQTLHWEMNPMTTTNRLPSSLVVSEEVIATLKSNWDRTRSSMTRRCRSILTAVAVAVASRFCRRDNNRPLTFLAVLVLNLVGSSVGFHSFLYFISVGYAAAVGLTSAAVLLAYNNLSPHPIPLLTNLHTILPLLWSIRLILFLLYREYLNWPQWHDKLIEVNQRAKMQSKFSVWMSCTLFYTCISTPCIYRMQHSITTTAAAATSRQNLNNQWGVLGCVGIALQIIGVVTETIADAQKASFKAAPGNRNKWCHTGLWKYSTHPNYLGDVVFWMGTYLGGMASYKTVTQWTLASFGLLGVIVVIKQATEHLDETQHILYSRNTQGFGEFRERYGFFGPKLSMISLPQGIRRKVISFE